MRLNYPEYGVTGEYDTEAELCRAYAVAAAFATADAIRVLRLEMSLYHKQIAKCYQTQLIDRNGEVVFDTNTLKGGNRASQ